MILLPRIAGSFLSALALVASLTAFAAPGRATDTETIHPEVRAWLDEFDFHMSRPGCNSSGVIDEFVGKHRQIVLIILVADGYLEGFECIPKLPLRALEILERAADIGWNWHFSPRAAGMHLEGSAGRKNLEKARYYFWRMAVDKEMQDSRKRRYALSATYPKGPPPQELIDAFAALPPEGPGDGFGSYDIALKLAEDRREWVGKAETVTYWLKRAARDFPREANYDLARWHFRDPNDSLSMENGVEYLRLSADAGYPEAMRMIGLGIARELQRNPLDIAAEDLLAEAYRYLWGALSHGEPVREALEKLEATMSKSTIESYRRRAEELGITKR